MRDKASVDLAIVGGLYGAEHLEEMLEGKLELIARHTLRVIWTRRLEGFLVAVEIRLLQLAEPDRLVELRVQVGALRLEAHNLLLERLTVRRRLVEGITHRVASITARYHNA